MFVENIDRKIIYNTQCKLDVINIFSVNETTQNLEDIKVKLSLKYQNFLDVFNQAQADKLSSHHLYDHKIKLTSDIMSSHCRAYWMFLYKLQKVKKYLNENLFKEFITSSKASYFSFILFTLKANKDLQFCVDYWKLNAIIKRNCYFLSLINEMIDKIVDCKHLTQLNIISTFNKLWMISNEIQVYVLLATNLLSLLAVIRRAERSHVALSLTQGDRHKEFELWKSFDV